jgi:hypothetical protein
MTLFSISRRFADDVPQVAFISTAEAGETKTKSPPQLMHMAGNDEKGLFSCPFMQALYRQ